MKQITLKSLLLISTATLPLASFATGFQSNEFSPTLQGQAMAGDGAAAGDVTAIFVNPAVLSTIHRPELYIGGTYYNPRLAMNNASAGHGVYSGPVSPSILPSPITDGSNSEKNIMSAVGIPAFYLALPVNSKLTYGISFTSPWNYHSHYAADSVVRYMAQNTEILSYNIASFVSYAVNDQLSFAGGIEDQYLYADFSNFNGLYTPSTPDTNASSASNMGGDNIALGYTLGMLYTPTADTKLGISYRSPILYTINGEVDQYVQTGGLAPTDACTSALPSVANNCHSFFAMHMQTPGVLNLSLAQQLNQQWQLNFTTEATFWGETENIDFDMPDAYLNKATLSEDWHTSVLYALGAAYKFNSQWTFRSGLGYETTPTLDNTRDARFPENDKVLAAIGSSYQWNQRLRLDLSYEHAFIANQSINANQEWASIRGFPGGGIPVAPVPVAEANQVQADYSGSADMLALGLNYIF